MTVMPSGGAPITERTARPKAVINRSLVSSSYPSITVIVVTGMGISSGGLLHPPYHVRFFCFERLRHIDITLYQLMMNPVPPI